MIKTYKYRIKDRSARKLLQRHAYACNQIWNWCVAQHCSTLERYQAGWPKRLWPSAFNLMAQCKGMGRELGIHQQTVGLVCSQWVRSRSIRFRSSYGMKRARGWIPFQEQSRQIDESSITYLGHRYRFFGSKRRPLPKNTTGGIFTEDAMGRWFVCFYVETEQLLGAAYGEVGIDLGLKNFAALSTGEKIETPKTYRRLEARLAIAQRAKNVRRTKAIHAEIASSRRDFQHKLSTRLAREHALIAVGNVNCRALIQTAMSKSVMDAGWYSFRNMLRYKATRFLEVDENFTTQTCSSCGALPPERPIGIAGLGIREWGCSSCGAIHDRDVNAAKNILNLGRSVTPLVEGSPSLGIGTTCG